jgi:hypothetical protein
MGKRRKSSFLVNLTLIAFFLFNSYKGYVNSTYLSVIILLKFRINKAVNNRMPNRKKLNLAEREAKEKE